MFSDLRSLNLSDVRYPKVLHIDYFNYNALIIDAFDNLARSLVGNTEDLSKNSFKEHVYSRERQNDLDGRALHEEGVVWFEQRGCTFDLELRKKWLLCLGSLRRQPKYLTPRMKFLRDSDIGDLIFVYAGCGRESLKNALYSCGFEQKTAGFLEVNNNNPLVYGQIEGAKNILECILISEHVESLNAKFSTKLNRIFLLREKEE